MGTHKKLLKKLGQISNKWASFIIGTSFGEDVNAIFFLALLVKNFNFYHKIYAEGQTERRQVPKNFWWGPACAP